MLAPRHHLRRAGVVALFGCLAGFSWILKTELVVFALAAVGTFAGAFREFEQGELKSRDPEPAVETISRELEPREFELVVETDGSRPTKKNARVKPRMVISVGAAQIDRWASRGLVPEAITRGSGGGMPAGLEIPLGSAFLPELKDGDRLVAVDSAGVSSVSDVTAIVVKARLHKHKFVLAEFRRRTPAGVIRFEVAFEQPYPPEE